jgi:hypothetical protein
MLYPATVKCKNIYESQERSEWAFERGMNLINRTWKIEDYAVQCVTFNFDKEEDALLFKLRWCE